MRIEKIIDTLQIKILEKVGSYGRDLASTKKEMSMMQSTFGKAAKKAPKKKTSSKKKTARKVPKGRVFNEAEILVIISAILLFILGLANLLSGIFPAIQDSLKISVNPAFGILTGGLFIVMGIIILLVNNRIRVTRKKGWEVFLLILSIIIILE